MKGVNSMAKILRASVMRKDEWFKERDQEEWKRTRRQVLKRDNSTCMYCGWQTQRFMQVNHIGAEDNHNLDNLETVCAACHAVLHIGIKSMQGIISAFGCKPGLTNMAKVVHATRMLVARSTNWAEIERQVLEHYALPDGHVYTCDETTRLANQMLKMIQPGEYRGYLPEGTAILFHQSLPWNGFPERVHMWQLPG
jgi:HNH endonuclease